MRVSPRHSRIPQLGQPSGWPGGAGHGASGHGRPGGSGAAQRPRSVVARAEAQRPPHSLAAVIADLRLTDGAGAREWLARLGVAAGSASHERLLAVSGEGKILRALDGSDATVVVTPEFDGDLVREGAGVVLVHNHPANTSLSQQDLGQLDKPGVAAIVAIGHDGSVYAAARPQAPPALADAGPSATPVCATKSARRCGSRCPRMATNASTAASYATHLTMLALAKAGYVDYFAAMAPERRATFDVAHRGVRPRRRQRASRGGEVAENKKARASCDARASDLRCDDCATDAAV